MDFMDAINNLAFPAAVAAFALWNSYKHEQYLQGTLTTMIDKNTKALEALKQTVEGSTWKACDKDEDD